MEKSGVYKKLLVLVISIIIVFSTVVIGNASDNNETEPKIWKYSFNPEVTAEGWIEAYSQVYDDAVGYGFDEANGWSAGIITKAASEHPFLNGAMVGLDTEDMDTLNAISRAVSEYKGDPEVNFYVNLPAGTYDIIVYAGAISRNETYDFNKIYINGEEIVRRYETEPWTTDVKSQRATLLKLEDIQWTKRITLTETTKIEIKSLNPLLENVTWFGNAVDSAGGRAYLNGVVIEEVTEEDTDITVNQNVTKYSFNPELTAEGWIGAYSQVYDDAVGYGFDAANDWSAGIITKTESENAILNGAMIGLDTDDTETLNAIRRAVSEYKGDTEVNFYVKLPAGTYNIIVYAGAISRNETYDFNKIYVNGEEIVRSFETDPWTTDAKSDRASLLKLEDIQWTKTITLTETTKVEIKSLNPLIENTTWFNWIVGSAGGRAYLNGVVIEEVEAADTTVYDGVDYSAVYDYSYYVTKYPGVIKKVGSTGGAVLEYFVNYGMAFGHQASEEFNPDIYKSNNFDLRTAYGSDYVSYYMHYINSGKAENRNGSTLMVTDETVYAGIDYSDVYDFEYYVENNEDLKAAFGDDKNAALTHFVTLGMSEGRQACAEFGGRMYKYNYPELQAAFGDDMIRYYYHYMDYGKAEGRNGATYDYSQYCVLDGVNYTPVYNYEDYIKRNPDVYNAYGMDAWAVLRHFVEIGMAEGRQGSDDFNANVYRSNYPDLEEAFGEDMKQYYWHYINSGYNEGRYGAGSIYTSDTIHAGIDYAAVYSYDYYVTAYPDVAVALGDNKIATLAHFIRSGMAEGRQGSAEFNVHVYMEKNPDLVEEFGDDLAAYYMHYIEEGKEAGRVAN